MKRVFKWLWNILEVVIIIYVIIVTACVLCKNSFGFTQFGNYTIASVNEVNVNYLDDSKVGNLIVISDRKNINKDDMVYYYALVDDAYVIKSGVVDRVINNKGSYLYELSDDQKTSVFDTRILGKNINQYVFLGNVKNVLESKIGFLVLVLLPIVIVFAYQIIEFVITIKRKNLEEDEVDEEIKENKNFDSVTFNDESNEKESDAIDNVVSDEEIVEENNSTDKIDEEVIDKHDDDIEIL